MGLSLFPVIGVKRPKFNNPFFKTSVQLLHSILCLISYFSSEKSPEFWRRLEKNLKTGNIGYLLNTRKKFEILTFLVLFLSLVSRCLHYVNYRNDKKPSYLKPFEMMSGLVSPKSTGLTEEEDINQLLKISKTYSLSVKLSLN
jgi:hypothetical protein